MDIKPFKLANNKISCCNNEIWVTLNWNGNYIYRYSISNFGRIYDHRDNKFIRYSTDKDGYFLASISIAPNVYKKIRVHRCELLSFNFIPNFEYMQVNHIDGNKQNLNLYNLEWVTPIDNTRHGWDTGLNNNIGINNGNGKFTDKLIMQICEYIDNGLTNADVCNKLGIFDIDERMRFSATVSGIRYGKTHRNISKNYNFAKDMNILNRYSLDFAELVCQFLSDPNVQYTYKEIMDLLDIPNSERPNFKIFIDDLIGKRTAKSVTSKYSMNKPLYNKGIYDYLMR